MKIRILPFLSVLFALPVCSVFAASTLDSITNATDAGGALSAYDSETSRLLSEYKSKLTNTEYKEIESLIKEHRSKYDKTSESDNENDDDDSEEQDKKEENDTESEKDTGDSKSSLRKPTAEEQKEIDELKDNATAMKDKEQSTANKLIGAAGIGATGIGGMMLASGLAEQSADTDAETAMRAYLETFYCKVGTNSSSVKGGTMGAIVPGGNELINLYSEYVNLANGLKTRKSALNLLPGIESEAILDSATSGLYDDIYTGKTGGAYASLARALQNPNGEDAKRWAEQKQKSSDDVKTGAITAGVGAAGSLIANLAVNAKSAKERSDEIKKKYADLPEKLEENKTKIENIPPVNTCPSGSTGKYPNCSCTNNNIYNTKENICTACGTNETAQNNACVPKQCNLHGLVKTDACECIDGTETKSDSIECVCKEEGYTYNNDQKKCVPIAVPKPETDEIATVPIPYSLTFKSGGVQPTTEISNQVKEIAKKLKSANVSADDTCIRVVGHTDRQPCKSTSRYKDNQALSKARADAIAKILNDNGIKNTITYGQAEVECTIPEYEYTDARCRRIDIIVDTGKCQSDENAAGAIIGNTTSITETLPALQGVQQLDLSKITAKK